MANDQTHESPVQRDSGRITTQELADEIRLLFLAVVELTDFVHEGMNWERERKMASLGVRLENIGETLAQHRGME